jgi:uncharacterized protein YegP (UPF0339 family)
MAAKFEFQTPKAGQYRWVLVSQGRVLATSPTYSRKALAEKAIVSFRMAAIDAPILDLTATPAKPPVAKAARAAGRAAAKAVTTGARAVEKVEQTTAKATRRVKKKLV